MPSLAMWVTQVELEDESQMYERFTDRARKAMHLANVSARVDGRGEVHPLHLLVGLHQEGSGAAYRALANLGVSFPPPVGTANVEGKLPLSAEAKAEHLLLAAAAHPSMQSVFLDLKTNSLAVREEVLRLLGVGKNTDARKGSQEEPAEAANSKADNGLDCIDAISGMLGREGFIAYLRGTILRHVWCDVYSDGKPWRLPVHGSGDCRTRLRGESARAGSGEYYRLRR